MLSLNFTNCAFYGKKKHKKNISEKSHFLAKKNENHEKTASAIHKTGAKINAENEVLAKESLNWKSLGRFVELSHAPVPLLDGCSESRKELKECCM